MEAHIKGHANDMNDDENHEEMNEKTSNASVQMIETKHNILLNTPSSSSSSSMSPNGLASFNHPIVTKYENNEGSNLVNFVEQFSIINSASSSPTSAANMPASGTGIATLYPDTPKDSEASSEQNSDGDDITYINMYSRFEQGVQYSGVNSALLATLQPITPTSNHNNNTNSNNNSNNNGITNHSNLIALRPLQQQPQMQNVYDANVARNNGYFVSNLQQQQQQQQQQQSTDYK
jgi:hypothetical protein